ncbi:hypothetical protein RIR_jg33300.t3 [Rhizophagus irregularis DAOM 181602=DAOM 197198]|nr:hypothetical protein RIR_jg33300.t3 [Rhizophagus irregularis DAOM 181602=DAOM 197198]
MKGDGFPKEYFKIRSGSDGLPCSEEREIPRFVRDLVGFRRKENQETKVRKIWRASEERKTKKPRFDLAGFRRKENQETKIRKIGWSGLPTFRKRRTKIRLGCLGCLLKNRKNQRFVSSGELLKNNQRFVYTNT